jgi:hypothetical protein
VAPNVPIWFPPLPEASGMSIAFESDEVQLERRRERLHRMRATMNWYVSERPLEVCAAIGIAPRRSNLMGCDSGGLLSVSEGDVWVKRLHVRVGRRHCFGLGRFCRQQEMPEDTAKCRDVVIPEDFSDFSFLLRGEPVHRRQASTLRCRPQ